MIKKTLYFGNPAYLSLKNGQMVIKLPEVIANDTVPESFKTKNEVTKPVEDIGVVVIDNKQVTITSGLMEALLENNCALITCDSRSMPTGLMLPLNGNTTQNERFREQIEASQPLRKQLWQQTMQQKITNQARVLEMCTKTETRCMHVWAKDVRSGDTENMEGRAAVYYWKNLFGDRFDDGNITGTDAIKGRNSSLLQICTAAAKQHITLPEQFGEGVVLTFVPFGKGNFFRSEVF